MATSIDGTADRTVSIGRVFSRAFATIGSNPGVIFGIAFLFGALPSAMLGYVFQLIGFTAANLRSGTAAPLTIVIVLVTVLVGLVFSMLTQGALVRATVAHSEGRVAGFGECALTGVRVIVPLFFLGVLFGLAVMLGFILLAVPGILLCLMWAVAAPALVEENTGVFGSFGRSRFLTRGARWKIFGIGLVAMVFYWIIAAIMGIAMLSIYGLQGMAGLAQSGPSFGYMAINTIVSTIVIAVVATIQTSLYVELRDWKDGPATEALTDIFA